MGRRGLLSRFVVSPRAKRRARVISVFLFGLLAVLSWWTVVEDGPSTARVITAIMATAAVILDVALPKRRRLRGSVSADPD